MNIYIILFAAIAFEVLGTMLLPVSQNFSKLFPSAILLISYGVSFYLLALLSQKLSLAIIYASWAGLGVFSVALLSYVFYKQTLNWQTIIGLFLIVIGVTIVNLYRGQQFWKWAERLLCQRGKVWNHWRIHLGNLWWRWKPCLSFTCLN